MRMDRASVIVSSLPPREEYLGVLISAIENPFSMEDLVLSNKNSVFFSTFDPTCKILSKFSFLKFQYICRSMHMLHRVRHLLHCMAM